MGRPKKYATEAEKHAAYRERWAVKSLRFEKRTAEVIESMSQEFGYSESEVVSSLIKFALTNRNWRTLGLYGRVKLTVAAPKRDDDAQSLGD